jgi:hypothetical protein
LVIELHHDSSFGDAASVFFKTIASCNFAISTRGELTVCKSRTAATVG